jgi:hypothetical protein
VFLIFIPIFLTRKIAKTHIILTQNYRKINSDFKYISYVFYSILIYMASKIAKIYIILAQILKENDADIERIRYVFFILN